MMVATNKKGTNMCGIAGFSLDPRDKIRADQLCTELLLGIESRGRMATGAAWVAENGHVWYQKDDITASSFVQTMAIPSNATHVILHTRYATQGSPSDVVEGVKINNHPIIASNPERTVTITGTHNGCLSNENEMDTLFGSLRLAEVDSEAFFAAVATNPADPIKALETVGGSAAVAWFSDADTQPTLHLARVRTSPVEWAKTVNGSFIYASTREALKTAMDKCGLVAASTGIMLPGEYHQIVSGKLDTTKFKPAYSYTPTVDWDQRTTFGSYTKTPDTPAKQPAPYSVTYTKKSGIQPKELNSTKIRKGVAVPSGQRRLQYIKGAEFALIETMADHLADVLTPYEPQWSDLIDTLDAYTSEDGWMDILVKTVNNSVYSELAEMDLDLSDAKKVIKELAALLRDAEKFHKNASFNKWPRIIAEAAATVAHIVQISEDDMIDVVLDGGDEYHSRSYNKSAKSILADKSETIGTVRAGTKKVFA